MLLFCLLCYTILVLSYVHYFIFSVLVFLVFLNPNIRLWMSNKCLFVLSLITASDFEGTENKRHIKLSTLYARVTSAVAVLI